MKFSVATIITFISLAMAAPSPEPDNLVPKACGSKYNSCGAQHQPACCSGLHCASGTCL
ncbi:hypothetical protein F4809DRAFT_665384 [Biscogniauxia mediterranea]|nr:hypothetical protein F4809DRAFT_665384 [Biscogniauxia mediterranea]